jgi:hypothetical protein
MKWSLIALVLAAFCPLSFVEAPDEDALVDVVQVAKQAARQQPRRTILPAPVPDAVTPDTPALPPREEPDWSPRRFSRPPPQ